jgi:hypothetical protein
MKTGRVIVILGMVLLLGGFGYLYQFAGLNNYIKAVWVINKLPEPEKTQEKKDFYGDSSYTMEYRGVLAGVNKIGTGGVWVWGRFGLKYFPGWGGSSFYLIDYCPDSSPQSVSNSVEKFVDLQHGDLTDAQIKLINYQEIDLSNIQNWSSKVKVGDYVKVLSNEDIGFLNGNLNAGFAYKGRYSFDLDSETVCKR